MMVLSDIWLWIGNLAFKYCVQKTNWKKKSYQNYKFGDKRWVNKKEKLKSHKNAIWNIRWNVIAINKLFTLCGHIHFLLWQTVTVHPAFLLKFYGQPYRYALSVRAGHQGLQRGLSPNTGLLKNGSHLSSECMKAGTFQWYSSICSVVGKRSPLPTNSFTTSLSITPSYQSSKQLEGAWMLGGLPLHMHCFPVAIHVLWRKRRVTTVRIPKQSTMVTLTYITNNSSR